MKVSSSEKNRDKILADIKEAMAGRKLADMVSITLVKGKLEVTISKLGTSTLTFSEKEHDKGFEYALTSEKIAFTHKAFKDEVTEKFLRVVEKAGGKVL